MESKEADAVDDIVYLLGFTPESTSDSIEFGGLEYAISHIDHENIRCWYVSFDASEFQGPNAAANLEDLEWLTPRVLAHQHAIDHLGRLGPLFPARFATLFSSIDALRESVSCWRSELENFFTQVAGKEEWACKIYLGTPQTSTTAGADQEKPNSTDGRGYLLARRQASEAKRRQSELIGEVVDQVEQSLDDVGVAVVRRPIIQLDNTDDGKLLIGNLALLIRHGHEEEIEALVSQYTPPDLLQREVSIELTGPFAPYSFCADLAAIDSTDD